MFHEKYCNGTYKQYENFEDCLEYLTSLPVTPASCPETAPAGGNSRSCKIKHRNLIPFSPKHCAHIGKLTKANGLPNYDEDGELKCSDEIDCPLFEDAPKLIMRQPPQGFIDAAYAYEAQADSAFRKSDGTFSIDNYKFPPLKPV